MMPGNGDIPVLRRLASRIAEISREKVQDERRRLWRLHNSLRHTRPPVLVRWFVGLLEIIPDASLECEDPFYRPYERALRAQIFQDWIGDDTVVEPWITVQARRITPDEGLWGLRLQRIPSPESGGSWKDLPPIKALGDAQRLVQPHHAIDEQAHHTRRGQVARRHRGRFGDQCGPQPCLSGLPGRYLHRALLSARPGAGHVGHD